jgi:putative Ca2+/H+ antiporter (TMEM165/GDT1 family)
MCVGDLLREKLNQLFFIFKIAHKTEKRKSKEEKKKVAAKKKRVFYNKKNVFFF